MRNLLLAAAAVTTFATPAHAQLLGGAGLGGGLTGGLNSALDINSTITRTTDTVASTTAGDVNGRASSDGNQSVDRHSGKVEAQRSADLAGAASIGQLASTPIAPIGGLAGGEGSASGNGEAQAQLIGTDAVRSTAGSLVGQARDTADRARSFAAPIVGQASDSVTSLPGNLPASGSAGGAGSASGEGSTDFASSTLAVAGSAAGAASGATAITPGMPVTTPGGLPIGEVREIVANSRGEVEQVVVSNGDTTQTMPASSLAASGGALVAGSGSANAGAGSNDDEPAT